jgi:hypothetical protein
MTGASIDIIEAANDPELFRSWFSRAGSRDPSTWRAWFVFLRSMFGLPMSEDDWALFNSALGVTIARQAALPRRGLSSVAARKSGWSVQLGQDMNLKQVLEGFYRPRKWSGPLGQDKRQDGEEKFSPPLARQSSSEAHVPRYRALRRLSPICRVLELSAPRRHRRSVRSLGRAKASVAVGRGGSGSVQARAAILVLIAHNLEKMVQWRRDALHRLLTHPLPHFYSIAPTLSRARRARALIRFFGASPSAAKSPCLRAFRLPLGAPPPAPCIRQT